MGVNGTGWSTSGAGWIRHPDSSIPRVNVPLTGPVECARSRPPRHPRSAPLNHLLRLKNPATPEPLAGAKKSAPPVFHSFPRNSSALSRWRLPHCNKVTRLGEAGRETRARWGVIPARPGAGGAPAHESPAPPPDPRPTPARSRKRPPAATRGRAAQRASRPRGTGPDGEDRADATSAAGQPAGDQITRRASPEIAAPAGVRGAASRRAGSTGPGSRIRPGGTWAKPSGR